MPRPSPLNQHPPSPSENKIRSKYYLSPSKTRISKNSPKKNETEKKPTAKTYSRTTSNKKQQRITRTKKKRFHEKKKKILNTEKKCLIILIGISDVDV